MSIAETVGGRRRGMERPGRELRGADRLPGVLTAAVGLLIWAVFYPGLMSYDSFFQLRQAIEVRFTDWHPPLISILLYFLLLVGGGVGTFLLAQCLAGVFAVRAFAAACLLRLFGGRISPRRAAWLSFVVLAVLLTPPSPLAFYLMTLWKDSLALVLLAWIGALGLRERSSAASLVSLLVLAAMYGQIRHNAVMTLPFLGFFLWIEAWQRLRSPRLFVAAPLLAAAPLAASLAVGGFLDGAFHVAETHPSSQVMAFELVGLCAEKESACQDFPLIAQSLRTDDYRSRYRPGDLSSVFWEEPVILGREVMLQHEELAQEYRKAVLDHPLLLARLKAKAFWALLGTERTAYFFHGGLPENPFGLSLNERFQSIRLILSRVASWAVAPGRPLRWLVGVHLVWLLANGLWIAGLFILSRRSPEGGRLRSLAFFLFVPLVYDLSYLFAATVPDFRFMFPATVLIQCLTLVGVLGMLAQKPAGRAPYRANVSE